MKCEAASPGSTVPNKDLSAGIIKDLLKVPVFLKALVNRFCFVIFSILNCDVRRGAEPPSLMQHSSAAASEGLSPHKVFGSLLQLLVCRQTRC